MADYVMPTNEEITEIAQEYTATLLEDDPLIQRGIVKIVEKDASVLKWEQKDKYKGLQQVRGYNGAPPSVQRVGAQGFRAEPGVYGEHANVDEEELTNRRRLGSFGIPVDVEDLIMDRVEMLAERRSTRIRQILWSLFTTGTFSNANGAGVIHTDTFPLQTFTAAITWATSATATPLANFRSVKLLQRGKGVRFDANAVAFMNQVTFNSMITNTNANDIAGRRTSGLNTLLALNMNELNSVLLGEDLPQIVIMDDGYFDEAGVFQLYVPNNKVSVVGSRPANQVIAEYVYTRNANNEDAAPGPATYVLDKRKDSGAPMLEVHDGHNGGPIIYYPGSLAIMTV